jgi:hypothetical protein
MRALSLFALLGLTSCHEHLKNYPNDNIIEEVAEFVIDQKLDVDVDLTPWSLEAK